MPTKRVRDNIPNSDVEGAKSNNADATKEKPKRTRSDKGKSSSGAAESNNGDETKEKPKRTRSDKGKSSSGAAESNNGDETKEKPKRTRSDKGKSSSGAAESNNGDATKEKPKRTRSDEGKNSSGAAEPKDGEATKEKQKKSRADNGKNSSTESDNGDVTQEKQKRNKSENGKSSAGAESKNGDAAKVCSRKMPKRAAACSDFVEKSVKLSDKSALIETKRNLTVEHETAALGLTVSPGHDDVPRPNRRLKDFIFHDSDGNPQGVEMLEVNDLFISGLILSLEQGSDEKTETGIRCDGFGRIESWDISGYEEGTPVIWISTEAADYDCLKPSARYKRQFDLFYEKAHACIEVYKKLSKAHGGNPNLTLDELIAAVVRSMSSSKNFPHGTSIKDFIISHGEFIYNQLAGMDASPTSDQTFVDLQVLIALRDENQNCVHAEAIPPGKMNASIKIGELANHSSPATFVAEEDENMKAARLLQEEDQWLELNKKKREYSAHSSNIYIKINEDEIANDYPLPAYYKTSVEEIDEFLVIDDDGINKLPENSLNNWTLYNSDARLISLELLPMKPCADIDVTIFGSGLLSEGGNEFCFDFDSNQPMSSSSSAQNSSGLPIYLSAIKEWMIEFGSSMIFVSIRTDTSWYRLGKPSKQYAPWFEPVMKTARLAISIITMLKDQARVSRLSFADVIKRISEFDKKHPAFISSNAAEVERYVVVHGQIILQQISEYPDKTIKNCPFVSGLRDKMQLKHHTKWRVNKKAVLKKEENLNPRAVVTIVSKRKAMPATTTKLINRIWGEYYSNYLPEDSKEDSPDMKEDDEVEEENENGEEELEEVEEQNKLIDEEVEKSQPSSKMEKSPCSKRDVKWDGMLLSKMCTGEALYKKAIVHGSTVAVGDFVLLEEHSSDRSSIYCIEYMFENSDARKMAHGRMLLHGNQTVLGNAADEREVFLTNDCLEFELDDVKQTVVVEIRLLPWGHQHRKTNALKDKGDRDKAEERKSKGLPMEYYCKSLYWPKKGAFFCLPKDTMGRGNGHCDSCRVKESEKEKESFKLNLSSDGFTYMGIDYSINDFLYLSPDHFATNENGSETFKGGRNVGLRPYAVCQLLEIESNKSKKQASPESTMVKIRRFFRPEDISPEKAYCSDIREVYYCQEVATVAVVAIEGKCEVRRKHDLPSLDGPAIFEHIFFCEHLYDADKGTVKHLPANIKLNFSKRIPDDAAYRKKGKCKEGETYSDPIDKKSDVSVFRLATLDIFAGCGGLSEGFEKAGVSSSKWAIEYEEPAAEAFKLNHPETLVFPNNCNVILRAIMSACGDADDCISTTEASELAEKLDEKVINSLPRPGEVEFICGGPPCQGFSGMNRFNQGNWSKVQCEMILAFLSFAEYFRPKYFLLENVRNFVSFNKGQTFRLTLASLLQMGYQVRFGILEAGTFGVSQSRKRAFIWAASPEVTLPEWPEPMHVFAGPELKVTLSGNSQYAAARSTAYGAPLRAITVRDTIGDLPAVGNGASATNLEYKDEPVSWFQKTIRGDLRVLTDHISKEMNELNVIRCKRIPKRPGSDWRDLPDEKVRLSNGQMVDLVPWCLPNTAKRHNQWKGLFGRLDWEGNFPTSVTDPQPMGKVGMCFHPEQDRIITVRECARSQGFPDSYKFAGNIQHKHRQIGNAVPPPLAYALGRKLKEAMKVKIST